MELLSVFVKKEEIIVKRGKRNKYSYILAESVENIKEVVESALKNEFIQIDDNLSMVEERAVSERYIVVLNINNKSFKFTIPETLVSSFHYELNKGRIEEERKFDCV